MMWLVAEGGGDDDSAGEGSQSVLGRAGAAPERRLSV